MRFSSTVGRGETEISVGKELEKDSLEVDLNASSETETNANCQDYEPTTAGGPGPLLKQAQELTEGEHTCTYVQNINVLLKQVRKHQ